MVVDTRPSSSCARVLLAAAILRLDADQSPNRPRTGRFMSIGLFVRAVMAMVPSARRSPRTRSRPWLPGVVTGPGLASVDLAFRARPGSGYVWLAVAGSESRPGKLSPRLVHLAWSVLVMVGVAAVHPRHLGAG